MPMAQRAQRYHIAKLFVDLSKELHEKVYGDESNIGASVDGVLVAACVIFGHAEGRPMSVNKIVLYLGMPRATVLRKLKELTALQKVFRRGKYYYGAKMPGIDLGRVTKLIRDHAEKLSDV